jgi:hypothetical protein
MRIQAKRILLDVPVGTPLAGWAGQERLCNGTDGALEANILMLSHDESHEIMIVLDTLFGADWLERELEAALCHTAKGLPVNVVTIGTHTHFAPPLDRDKPLIGRVDVDWQAKLVENLTTVLISMLQNRDASIQAGISVASGQIPLSVSRRKRWRWPLPSKRSILRFPGIINGPNFEDPVDQTGSVAVITGKKNEPICVIANWAAHPTIFPDLDKASNEYIGAIRSGIRNRLGFDLPVLFLQGFAGDVRPLPPAKHLSLKKLFLHGPVFPAFDRKEWNSFCTSVSAHFDKLLAEATHEKNTPASETTIFRSAYIDLSELVKGNDDARTLRFRYLAIAQTLAFVFVPAEPSSKFTDVIRSIFPTALPVGYSGDVFGYWPTDGQVKQGGYEAKDFFPLFGLKGKFKDRNDELFKTAVESLKNQLV